MAIKEFNQIFVSFNEMFFSIVFVYNQKAVPVTKAHLFTLVFINISNRYNKSRSYVFKNCTYFQYICIHIVSKTCIFQKTRIFQKTCIFQKTVHGLTNPSDVIFKNCIYFKNKADTCFIFIIHSTVKITHAVKQMFISF